MWRGPYHRGPGERGLSMVPGAPWRPSPGVPLVRGTHVACARSQELSRRPLLGDVRDPTRAPADAEEDLARPGLQTQGVRDCEETHVEVRRTELQPGRLAHQRLQR